MYQGGIRVPLIISGKGVTRKGEKENALVNIDDIYATILELAGADLEGGIYNSLSFDHLLQGESGSTRTYNYSEIRDGGLNDYTIRNEEYKLIKFEDSTEELYHITIDSFEITDLIAAVA